MAVLFNMQIFEENNYFFSVFSFVNAINYCFDRKRKETCETAKCYKNKQE